jgi:small-conductance mechanosensitive channel
VERRALEVHWLQPDVAKATRRVVIVVMWIFALTVAYPYIPGSNSAAFKGVSVFVGLMVSLGATGLVNQIVSGMVIVYARAFSPGEYVRMGDTEGVVEEIGVLSTKVSTRRREHITIPNAVLINTSVTNYSRDAEENGAIISTAVTIGYDVPWRQVHALLKLAASRCSKLRHEPEPLVLQNGLSDFYVEYVLIVGIDDPADRYIVSSDLHGLIQDAFNEHGVQILSPHYLDKAEEPVVVPKDRWSPPPADSEKT